MRSARRRLPRPRARTVLAPGVRNRTERLRMTTDEAEQLAMRRALDARGHPGRTPRTQPAGRVRAACPGRYDDRRGLPPSGRHAARRGRSARRGGRGRPRRHRRGDPGAVQPHRSHRPVQRGADRRRRATRGVRPDGLEPGRRRGCRPRCAKQASRSRAGSCVDEAQGINRTWTFAVAHRRPFVTWKFATTLDGRSAAADGTSRWVSSRAARLDTHRLRGLVRHDAGRHPHRRGRRPRAHRPRRAGPAGRRPAAASRDGRAGPAG